MLLPHDCLNNSDDQLSLKTCIMIYFMAFGCFEQAIFISTNHELMYTVLICSVLPAYGFPLFYASMLHCTDDITIGHAPKCIVWMDGNQIIENIRKYLDYIPSIIMKSLLLVACPFNSLHLAVGRWWHQSNTSTCSKHIWNIISCLPIIHNRYS